MARVSTKVLGFCLLALLIGSAIAESDKRDTSASSVLLSVIGSKVPRGLMASWSRSFQTATNQVVKLSYGDLQTGVAKQLFRDSTAANMIVSDLPLTQDESTTIQTNRGSGVVHAPLAVAGLAIAYNKNSLSFSGTLNLSPALLAQIFSGAITNWNDPAISAENPGFSSPNLMIKPIVMDGQAGTTYTFSRYLYGQAPTLWLTSPSYTISGGANAIHVTTPEDANSALAAAGTIAYVSFADAGSLFVAAIKNAAGTKYVLPTLDSILLAAQNPAVALPTTGTDNWADNHLLGSPNANAYPISFYAYSIFLTEQADAGANGAALGAFILWSQTSAAQSATNASSLAPLPASVLTLNNNTMVANMHYSQPTTDYWPYVAPVAPAPLQPEPVAAPVLKTIPSSGLQIVIIVVLVILIVLVIGYDQYRGGCIIKCNSTGRGIWA